MWRSLMSAYQSRWRYERSSPRSAWNKHRRSPTVGLPRLYRGDDCARAQRRAAQVQHWVERKAEPPLFMATVNRCTINASSSRTAFAERGCGLTILAMRSPVLPTVAYCTEIVPMCPTATKKGLRFYLSP
jgi:hypothetical protein